MHKKYPKEFDSMYERIVLDKEEPLKVIIDNRHIIDRENIGLIKIIHYFGEYLKERELEKVYK